MDQYLETLGMFYDEKMKYLTKKDKYIRCKSCDTEKEFQENVEELILSCGSGKNDECGPQIIIKLPKYIHYETEIGALKEQMNDEYNWEALQNYLDVEKDAKTSEEKRKTITEEIQRIEQLFFKKNMEMKQQKIQEFYDERIRKTKQCKVFMKELNKETDEQKRKEYLHKYITLIQEMNKEYERMTELLKDIDPYLVNQEPDITIKHDKFEYKKEKGKRDKKEGKEFIEEQLIEKIFNLFIENDGIITREDYIDMKEEGDFKTEWGSTLLNSLQLKTKNHPWKKKEQEKYGPIINEPSSTDPDQIECSKKWMEYLTTKQFKAGMKVSWMYKDKKKLGTIKELKGKGALVEDEKGKERIRALKELTIERN